ncbi:hypothetical protein ATR1_391d0001, partial [Acetobacter tropicalis]
MTIFGLKGPELNRDTSRIVVLPPDTGQRGRNKGMGCR